MLLTHAFFFVLGILLINSMLGSTLQEINPQPASYDDDFQLALNRSLIITVNDDINDGRVKLSVCKIAIFNLCPIIPGQNVRLNDTVACLLRNADEWDEEATCSILFESIVKNIDEVCSADSFGLCANMTTPKDQPYYYEKLTALTCYAQNYFAEGVDCQSYLDQLIVNVIPCALEAGKYCPDVSSDKKMTCLNDTLSHKDNTDFTVGCKSLVGIWSAGYIGATVSPIINITRKHRDKAVTNSFFSDDDASIVWSQAVKGKQLKVIVMQISATESVIRCIR